MKTGNVVLLVIGGLGIAWLLAKREPETEQIGGIIPTIITLPSGGVSNLGGLIPSISFSMPTGGDGAGTVLDQVTNLITALRGAGTIGTQDELRVPTTEQDYSDLIERLFSQFTELAGGATGLVSEAGAGVVSEALPALPFTKVKEYDVTKSIWTNFADFFLGKKTIVDPPSTHYLTLFDAGQIEIEDIPAHRRWVVEDILAQRIINQERRTEREQQQVYENLLPQLPALTSSPWVVR